MNLEHLRLIKELFTYFRKDFTDVKKDTPLLVTAWLNMFSHCDDELMTEIALKAMQSFTPQYLPSPLEVYENYFGPRFASTIDKEWRELTRPRSSKGNTLEFLHDIVPLLSNEGMVAFEAIGGAKTFCGDAPEPNSYVKHEFGKKWVEAHHNLREGVIKTPPRALKPMPNKPTEEEYLSKEEARIRWQELNEKIKPMLNLD